MANPHRGEVALQVGDQTYTLSFSVNAICELEDAFGNKPVGQVLLAMNDEGGISMKTVRTIIWAGLQDHHKDLDEHAAGVIASEVGVTKIMKKIEEAMKLAYPEQEAGNSKDRPRKARRTAPLDS